MDTIVNILLVLLLVFFCWATVYNMVVIPKSMFTKHRCGSPAPLAGGICGSIVIVFSRIEGLQEFWWIPLLLDIGCIPFLFFSIVFYLYNLVIMHFENIKSRNH